MMLWFLINLTLLGCVTTLPTLQQPLAETRKSPLNAEFDELVNELLQFFKVPGLSIAVLSDGETFTKVQLFLCHLFFVLP